jgi:hypothetical protein
MLFQMIRSLGYIGACPFQVTCPFVIEPTHPFQLFFPLNISDPTCQRACSLFLGMLFLGQLPHFQFWVPKSFSHLFIVQPLGLVFGASLPWSASVTRSFRQLPLACAQGVELLQSFGPTFCRLGAHATRMPIVQIFIFW